MSIARPDATPGAAESASQPFAARQRHQAAEEHAGAWVGRMDPRRCRNQRARIRARSPEIGPAPVGFVEDLPVVDHAARVRRDLARVVTPGAWIGGRAFVCLGRSGAGRARRKPPRCAEEHSDDLKPVATRERQVFIERAPVAFTPGSHDDAGHGYVHPDRGRTELRRLAEHRLLEAPGRVRVHHRVEAARGVGAQRTARRRRQRCGQQAGDGQPAAGEAQAHVSSSRGGRMPSARPAALDSASGEPAVLA